MKTVDLSHLASLPKDYDFSYFCADDYTSLEECCREAMKNVKRQEEALWGMTFVYITSWDHINQLPSHEEKFYIDGVECEEEQFMFYEGVDYYHETITIHHTSWSEDVLGDNNYRLTFRFLENGNCREDFDKVTSKLGEL